MQILFSTNDQNHYILKIHHLSAKFKTYLTRLKTSVSLKCMNEFLSMVDRKSGDSKFVLIVSLVILNLNVKLNQTVTVCM